MLLFIKVFLEYLNIDTKIIRMSEYKFEGKKMSYY